MNQTQTNKKRNPIVTEVSSGSLSKKKETKKWAIVIEPDYCKSCGICIEFCPTHVLEFSDERNSMGGFYPVVVDPQKCTKCRMCEMRCPDFAIYLMDIPPISDQEEKKGETKST
ncbi:MAG: 4Fe-4S dicluster domain-containing protein [Candidatus Ranarchaeia archaeon]